MTITLAERLSALRAQTDATQQEVAHYVGVSRPTVTQWESGAKVPSRDNLSRLADLFRISLDEMLRGTDVGARPEAADEAETLRLLRQASPSVRDAVLTILRGSKPA